MRPARESRYVGPILVIGAGVLLVGLVLAPISGDANEPESAPVWFGRLGGGIIAIAIALYLLTVPGLPRRYDGRMQRRPARVMGVLVGATGIGIVATQFLELF